MAEEAILETERDAHTPAKITPPKGFRLLSQEVENVSQRLRLEWIKAYDLALQKGEIEAVVINREFAVKAGGKHRHRPDEAIMDTPAYSHWANAVLRQLEKSHAKGKLRVAISLEELVSGQANWSELASQNRELTKRTAGVGKQRTQGRKAATTKAIRGQRKSPRAKGTGNA